MSGFEGKPVTKEAVKGSTKSDSPAADTKNVHQKLGSDNSKTINPQHR